MKVRKATTSRARISGVSKIARHGYDTINGVDVKHGWYQLQARVASRSGGQCEDRSTGCRCLLPANEVHHIVALSAGGSNTMSNLIHLCAAHHDKRHRHLFRARTLGAAGNKPAKAKRAPRVGSVKPPPKRSY